LLTALTAAHLRVEPLRCEHERLLMFADEPARSWKVKVSANAATTVPDFPVCPSSEMFSLRASELHGSDREIRRDDPFLAARIFYELRGARLAGGVAGHS
jgi:hypothetical protein